MFRPSFDDESWGFIEGETRVEEGWRGPARATIELRRASTNDDYRKWNLLWNLHEEDEISSYSLLAHYIVQARFLYALDFFRHISSHRRFIFFSIWFDIYGRWDEEREWEENERTVCNNVGEMKSVYIYMELSGSISKGTLWIPYEFFCCVFFWLSTALFLSFSALLWLPLCNVILFRLRLTPHFARWPTQLTHLLLNSFVFIL